MVTKETKASQSRYGQLPGPRGSRREKNHRDDTVITVRPADLLKPEYDKLKEEIGDLARSEEDVLSYALFPQVARTFFEKRLEKETGISDELLAVITAAIRAHGGKAVHPLIRNAGDSYNVSAGIPAINPLIRNR
jgi:oxaloacetate decarboxylase alpha subunit